MTEQTNATVEIVMIVDFNPFQSCYSTWVINEAMNTAGKKRPRNPSAEEDTSMEGSSNSPVIEMFTLYQKELDARYDRRERLVKLSRDCTTQSKRIIFLLHRVSSSKSDDVNDEVFLAAQTKLQEVLKIIRQMANELSDQDPNKFRSSFTIGIEEYIEALSYYVFLKEARLVSLQEVQQWLTFPLAVEEDKMEAESDEKETSLEKDRETESRNIPPPQHSLIFPLTPVMFVLGIGDLTGELMRLSINAVGSGNREMPFSVLQFIRDVYSSFLRLWPGSSKELPKKVEIMKTSLLKIEQVCYTIRVRGSELSQNMLADLAND